MIPRLRLLVAIGLGCALTTYASDSLSAPKTTSSTTPIVRIPPSRPPEKEWGEIRVHLASIDSAVTTLAKKADKPDLTAAWFGFLGVVVGTLVSGLISWVLGRDRAKFELGSSFVQWQLQQLAELYGPLHAHLQQSNALYRHMNRALEKRDPQQFRLRECTPEAADADFDKKVFEISIDGSWTRFRTIIHIDKVYGKGYGIEPYFDELVAIGARIVEVIQQMAGYARPDQRDLSDTFGKYLAHYSVLRQVHAAVKEGKSNLSVDKSAAFPAEIQSLVSTGFNAISSELEVWRSKAR